MAFYYSNNTNLPNDSSVRNDLKAPNNYPEGVMKLTTKFKLKRLNFFFVLKNEIKKLPSQNKREILWKRDVLTHSTE